MEIKGEFKKLQDAHGKLKGYAAETVALYVVSRGENLSKDDCEKFLERLKEVGKEVMADGYSKDDYESVIDEEVANHDKSSLLKYGFTSKDVLDAMGEIWCEENENV